MVEDLQNLRIHIFNTAQARFYMGNYNIGYKVKYRLSYDKLLNLLAMKKIQSEDNDKLWSKMCRRVITTIVLMKPKM